MIKKIKQEMKKWKNFTIASLILGLFFVLEYFHSWANDFFINLHFCDHFFCMLFSIIFFAFAYFTWKNKRSYVKIGLIVLVVGIVLMNLTYCENGTMSFKNLSGGLFTTYPVINVFEICADSCINKGWDVGEATKVANFCHERGDKIGDDLEVTESSYFYDEINNVHCCCYNTIESKTCEDFGYYTNPPFPHNGWEQINIGGLDCWKSPPEKNYVCCEIFNLDKTGEKIDIYYEELLEDDCILGVGGYDGAEIVSDSLCKK